MLRQGRWKPWEKIVVLLAFSGALAIGGWAWHFHLPYNKPVWTASYILWTAGLGGCVLTLLYALVDASGREWTQWLAFPLVVYGSNAIAAYVGPILIKVFILRVWTWPMPGGTRETLEQALLHTATAHYGPYRGGWVYTLGYLLVVWLVLLELRRRKLFLRV
jgi:predicted acyltransferase